MSRPSLSRLILTLGLVGMAGMVWADDRAAMEDALFENSDGMVQVQAQATPEPPEPKVVGFSGELTTVGVETFGNSNPSNALYTYSVAEIYLDARLPQGAKVFGNLEANLYGQSATTEVALREMFLDFNVQHAVYFRAGKQVLQWGRCYLWNPTDLINIERRSFVRKIGNREGAYGLKAHAPFGTWMNLYGFVDTGSATQADQTSASFKAEWLIANFEMAASAWMKKGYLPVWGYDFSTRLWSADVVGEVSVSRGQNHVMRAITDDTLELSQNSETWTPQACLDISKKFQVGDFKDRLSINLEGYYNGAGYSENIFNDKKIYTFARPITVHDAQGNTHSVMSGTQLTFFQMNNLYTPNYHARYYAAVFTSFSRFLLTDMSLDCNYIHNCVDQSGTLTAGLTYSQLNNLTLGILGLVYLGEADREFTFNQQNYGVQASAGLSF